jgi:fatty acid-binding protein DegV
MEAGLVRQYNPDADIQIMGLSPVIGAHTGPGMVAVIFYGTRISG